MQTYVSIAPCLCMCMPACWHSDTALYPQFSSFKNPIFKVYTPLSECIVIKYT